MTARRWPLQPLVEASGLTEAALAQRVGLTGTPLKRAREHGLVETAADRYAVRAGLVPWLVWPEWFESTEATCPECEERFVPSRKGHTYCTEACYQRQYKRSYQRRRYASDPEFRAAKNERAREYRARSKRALLVKQRRWKAENAERQREYRRRYYLENRERLLAKQREYDARKRAERAA